MGCLLILKRRQENVGQSGKRAGQVPAASQDEASVNGHPADFDELLDGLSRVLC